MSAPTRSLPQTVTRQEFANILHISLAAFWLRMRRGELPRPLPTGGRRLLWRLSDVERYLEVGSSDNQR